MDTIYWRICDLARRQHGVVAVWQLKRLGLSRSVIDSSLRGWRRVHRGVCALGDLSEHGWLMAAALAAGPGAAISHGSGVMLLGLRPHEPHEIHVSVAGYGGRERRDGIRVHRRRRLDAGTCHGIPVTSPTQSLREAGLLPHELYRALEEAERQGLRIDRPSLPLSHVFELQRVVRGRTRSDAEARFVLLCAQYRLELPLVNHRLNGFEADFHWPRQRLVVEVDGYEYHKERPQFEEDRRRGLVHTVAGYTILRASARQVEAEPDLVAGAVASALSARSGNRPRPARPRQGSGSRPTA